MIIVSGGQTGVDRAAHDVAIALGLPYGGWVPRGRICEEGTIPARYEGLCETESDEYAVRTEWNVRDSDATLVLRTGPATGGTLMTLDFARAHGKPCLDLQLGHDERDAGRIRAWLDSLGPVARLNVAGPRESGSPGIHRRAARVLARALGA